MILCWQTGRALPIWGYWNRNQKEMWVSHLGSLFSIPMATDPHLFHHKPWQSPFKRAMNSASILILPSSPLSEPSCLTQNKVLTPNYGLQRPSHLGSNPLSRNALLWQNSKKPHILCFVACCRILPLQCGVPLPYVLIYVRFSQLTFLRFSCWP